MATLTKFDGKGSKSVNFNFGDVSFTQDVEFDSEVTLNNYDVALYLRRAIIDMIK
jgi:hypothetical protein